MSDAGRLAELTGELIRIPTVNPPGDEGRVADLVEDYLSGQGVRANSVPLAEGRRSLVARIPGEEEGEILLCGHLDTVGTEDDWSFPPLSGEVRDGRVWGRGAADMKGGVAVLLEAFLWAARQGRPPRHGLVLALTADEEGDYLGARSLRKRGLLSSVAFMVIAEPTSGAVYIGQKGELWIRAVFTGRGTHGSVPHLGINAALAGCAFAQQVVAAVQALPPRACGRTSVNLGRIQGGWKVNAVPDRCTVELDIRPASRQDAEIAQSLVQKIGDRVAVETGAGFSWEKTQDRAPILVSEADPWVRRFLAAVGATLGKPPATGLAPYSTDAVEIAPQLGIPFVVYGPGSIAQAHRPDEYVEVKELAVAWQAMIRFLDDVLFKGGS